MQTTRAGGIRRDLPVPWAWPPTDPMDSSVDGAGPLWSCRPLPFSKAAVRAVQAMNRICVLDVDLQGVRNIKKTDLRPIYISVQPPSLDVLVGDLAVAVGWEWG